MSAEKYVVRERAYLPDTKDSPTQDNRNPTESILTTKKKLAIFTTIGILVLIIVALLVVIIVLLGEKKVNTNENQTTQFPVHQIESTSVISPEIYQVGNGGAVDSTDPCSSHTVINDPTRNIYYEKSAGTCDNDEIFNTKIGGRWIRFIGSGGTILSNFFPGYSRCGAYLSIWTNMTLPTVTNTMTNGTVCYESWQFRCFTSVFIHVVKCTDFYVYFLPPMQVCKARYCTM